MRNVLQPCILLTAALACSDGPTEPNGSMATFPGVVSDAVTPASAIVGVSRLSSSVRNIGGFAWIGASPGSLPSGESANITNHSTGSTVDTPISDGGFDPVAVAAESGDSLTIAVTYAGGRMGLSTTAVPARRRPRIVRTSPAAGQTAVALNASVVIVFSEPMATSTTESGRIQLQSDGAVVLGTLTPLPGSSTAYAFTPANRLLADRTYQLVIDAAVADLAGDTIEGERTFAFTTANVNGDLASSPSDVNFHVAPSGGSVLVTIANNSAAMSQPLRLGLADGVGVFSLADDRCTGSALPADASCTVTVSFTPVGMSPLTYNAQLFVTGGPNLNFAVPIVAKTNATLSIVPNPAFPTTLMAGTSSEPITLTVTNTDQWESGELLTTVGECDSGFDCGPALDPSAFVFSNDSCTGATLQPGESCTVTLVLDTGRLGASDPSSYIIFFDYPEGPSVSPHVTIQGLATDGIGLFTFPDVTVGSTTRLALPVRNGASGTTGPASVALEHSASDFTVVSGPNDCEGRSLQPGAECSIWVDFSPTATGIRTEVVQVSANPGGLLRLSITGSGR